MKCLASLFVSAVILASVSSADDAKVLRLPGLDGPGKGKKVVLIAGDEEYRTEESMPMLGKILSQNYGFDCVVVFSWDKAGKYIDPNNQEGLRGLSELKGADLMIIGTRFRKPDAEQAQYIVDYLNSGQPVIGIRTATHAFNGDGKFGKIPYGKWGREILGEQWVSHHGAHKKQGARAVVDIENSVHSILRGVSDVFGPSDVYGVKHLDEENDIVLLRGAVTESLAPDSSIVKGPQNEPMQALAWLHNYVGPNGAAQGQSFCTTMGASVDLVNPDLRRLLVNAAFYLTGLDIPMEADVDYVDPFYPSFFGFIKDPNWYKDLDYQPEDFGLGKTPHSPDPKGSPEWNFRDKPSQ
ncbi:MAG: ThuA domain-containing protein [Verrucomicrobiales bacterium]|nr:ThuA domain-containing protein [Verrucomicrobiales bacterium]